MTTILVWLIGFVLAFAVWAYLSGRKLLPTKNFNEEFSGPMTCIILFWPLVLLGVLIGAPFVGMWWLGKWHRKPEEKAVN